EEALASYDRALAIRPDYADALYSRGITLCDLKRPEEALASYDRALAIRPDHAEALNNRGITLCDLKRPEEALASFDRALAIGPDHAEALNNRGNALLDLKRPGDALLSFDRALAIGPDYAEALNNRGIALRDLNRLDDALASHDRALAIKPDYVEAHFNEGLVRLLIGDFRRGWEKYEWRWEKEPGKGAKRNFPKPLWLNNGDIAGKTILLHSEQGLGDTIQFCRYAKIVSEKGGKVVLEVQPPLKALLAGTGGVDRVIGKGEVLPEFDYHCPLLSLPLAFRTTLESIPADIPYLAPAAERVQYWARCLPQFKPLRVGIVWSGSPTHKNDRNRSIPLGRLAPLFDMPNIQFVSIQKDVTAEDSDILGDNPYIHHAGQDLRDFADAAAVVSMLDLVISVDTSVAHLVGAMGKPVWILLPFVPDWRWLLGRDDSPWYPTARLFRQPKIGDWDSVIERLRQELMLLAARTVE
ncbi:MAG: tetratricopeptide repeat-containing glycosyltransferase family protein, partial [Alphaproteobacteria bacterium]